MSTLRLIMLLIISFNNFVKMSKMFVLIGSCGIYGSNVIVLRVVDVLIIPGGLGN